MKTFHFGGNVYTLEGKQYNPPKRWFGIEFWWMIFILILLGIAVFCQIKVKPIPLSVLHPLSAQATSNS